jgi:hypothetical protein
MGIDGPGSEMQVVPHREGTRAMRPSLFALCSVLFGPTRGGSQPPQRAGGWCLSRASHQHLTCPANQAPYETTSWYVCLPNGALGDATRRRSARRLGRSSQGVPSSYSASVQYSSVDFWSGHSDCGGWSRARRSFLDLCPFVEGGLMRAAEASVRQTIL